MHHSPVTAFTSLDADALLLRVQSAIYTPVVPLELTAWQTAEPVPFA